jgi:hypothetical protein
LHTVRSLDAELLYAVSEDAGMRAEHSSGAVRAFYLPAGLPENLDDMVLFHISKTFALFVPPV